MLAYHQGFTATVDAVVEPETHYPGARDGDVEPLLLGNLWIFPMGFSAFNCMSVSIKAPN